MNNFIWLYDTFVWAAIISLIFCRIFRISSSYKFVGFCILCALLHLPLPNVPYSTLAYITNWMSSLSVMSAAILGVYLLRSWDLSYGITRQEKNALCIVIVFASTMLYLSVNGWGFGDLYAIGFRPYLLITGMGIIFVFCWIIRFYIICGCLILIMLGYYGHILPSNNLWDYLFDPLLVLWALFCFAIIAIQWAMQASVAITLYLRRSALSNNPTDIKTGTPQPSRKE